LVTKIHILRYYTVKILSFYLYCMSLVQYRDMTDTRTDRQKDGITIASTSFALRAVAREN